MFEIGWTEMLVIAVVMIVVVGPKDLPRMLRTMGRMTAKARSMASDFQRQFNEALKEAELDDVKKSVDELRGLNPVNEIKRQLNPFEQAAADVRSGIDSAMKPSAPAQPASDATHTAEPLKNGATAMPGVAGPETMPEAPVFPAPETRSTPVPAAAAPVAAESAKPKAPAKARSAAKPKVEAKPAAKPKTVAVATKTAAAPKVTAAKATVAKAPAAKAAEPKAAAAKKTTKAGKAS